MLVKQVNLPVNKRAQEVTFAKLDDTFRVLRAGKSRRFKVFTMGSLLEWSP